MPRYKVIGENTKLNASWVDENGQRQQKIFTQGEEVELPMSQALEHRWLLQPLDDAGKFPESNAVSAADLRAFPAHERQQMLEQKRDELQKQLDAVNKDIESTKAEAQAARKETPADKRDAKDFPRGVDKVGQ